MKKIATLLLVAATALIVSCQKNETTKQPPVGEEMNVSFNAVIPGNITTYGSADGGATNLQAGGVYDLRYVLEMCKAGTTTLAYREVKTTRDFSTPVHFDFSVPSDTYEILIWADFVLRGTTADLFYDASNIRTQVKMIAGAAQYAICQEARDAYYTTSGYGALTGGQGTVTLTRPFGKMRFIALDRLADPTAPVPAAAKVDYNNILVPSTFNLSVRQPEAPMQYISLGEYAAEATAESNIVINNTLLPGDNYYVLAFDYLFPNPAQPTIPVLIKTYDAANAMLGTRLISAVPVAENKLTTVIGRYYSGDVAVGLDVSVEDAFDGELPGMLLTQPVPAQGFSYLIASKVGVETEVWFGQGGTDQTNDWATYSLAHHENYTLVILTVSPNTGARRTGDLFIGKRDTNGDWDMDKTFCLRVDQQAGN